MGCDQNVVCLYSKSMFRYQFHVPYVSTYLYCCIGLYITWKSNIVFHILLSCSRKKELHEVYGPQIENYFNRWIIASPVAKDLVFWDLKVKPGSCDTICFLSKMTWKEKNVLQEKRKKRLMTSLRFQIWTKQNFSSII